MQNKINYIVAAGVAAAFMTAYYLPGKTLLAAFLAVLFLVPAAFFVGMVQKVAIA